MICSRISSPPRKKRLGHLRGRVIVAAGGLAVWVTVGAAAAQPAEPLADFVDGFDRFNGERWYVSDGWSNGAHQNCTWSMSAVRVKDGLLRLLFDPQVDGSHLCGEIQSRRRALHGTFGFRGRVAQASGLNAAFFTYIGPTHEQPHDEIDIELLTVDPASVSFNTYVDGEPHHGSVAAVQPAADESWHDYAFHWEPEGVTWFIDGREVYRTPADAAPLPSHAQKIYLSFWGSETLSDWMGPFEAPSGPVAFEVDCVWYARPDQAGRAAGPTTAGKAACP